MIAQCYNLNGRLKDQRHKDLLRKIKHAPSSKVLCNQIKCYNPHRKLQVLISWQNYLGDIQKKSLIFLTKKELIISKLFSKNLKKEKIFFAGIDFIDGQLNGDINVTSPTGLNTYYDISKINLALAFWKEFKA